MPQIGLIREDEKRLSPDTVKAHMHTRLSSRHFRNELLLYREYFEEFRESAQMSWPGLRITNLDIDEERIELIVYDADFAAEIGQMGSGLQMWLQMVWYISRCPIGSTIVLDEPDVYMHPDLQQKIFKIVQRKFRQVIIATHSVEIISLVEPKQIVTVDKRSRKMQYADSYQAVQDLVDNLGGMNNLSLIRLGGARKCVFVEGKDLKLLSKFHELLYPDSNISLEQLPTVSLGGWSRFDEALGAARLFYDQTNGEFKTICILDRDYHFDEARLVTKEMAESLALDLVDKGLVTNQIVLTVGYDIENLATEEGRKNYKGTVVMDSYGRLRPKHAHGTINLKEYTASAKKILTATEALFDKITDKNLLVRRVNIVANHVLDTLTAEKITSAQLPLFTEDSLQDESAEEHLYQKQQEKIWHQKEETLQQVTLKLKKRFGKNAILRGMNLEEGATTKDRNRQIGGHKA